MSQTPRYTDPIYLGVIDGEWCARQKWLLPFGNNRIFALGRIVLQQIVVCPCTELVYVLLQMVVIINCMNRAIEHTVIRIQ